MISLIFWLPLMVVLSAMHPVKAFNSTESGSFISSSATTTSIFEIFHTTTFAPQFTTTVGATENFTAASNFTDFVTGFSTTQCTTDNNYTFVDPPIVQFFTKVVQKQVIGARHCKHDWDCGTGLACNTFFNLCAPINTTEVFSAFEGNCSFDTDCSDMHFCINGTCQFCGPTTCRTNLDCCSGISNVTFECVNVEHLEKHAIAIQLGRAMKAHTHGAMHDSHEEVESGEVLAFGSTAQGDRLFHHKRCWAKCVSDDDCFYSGFPLAVHDFFGCCNGFCTRKESCVTVPTAFLPTTTTADPKVASNLIKKTRTAGKKFVV